MSENNKNNLIRAISELPDFHFPEELVWQKIEKKLEENEHKFIDSSGLPCFKAPEKIWLSIENELNKNDLHTAKQSLPVFNAPERIWKNIEAKLPARKYFITRQIIKYAASLLILISIGITSSKLLKTKEEGTITYSLEKLKDPVLNNLQLNKNIINTQLCQQNPEVCNTPQYNELNRQLEEVSTELEKLKQIIEKQNNNQSLKYFYMLENKKAEIEKKMIRLVLET